MIPALIVDGVVLRAEIPDRPGKSRTAWEIREATMRVVPAEDGVIEVPAGPRSRVPDHVELPPQAGG